MEEDIGKTYFSNLKEKRTTKKEVNNHNQFYYQLGLHIQYEEFDLV